MRPQRHALRIVTICAVVAAGASGLVATPIAEAATVVASGSITSGMAGGCLDVNNGSSANGATVDLWSCNGWAPAQSWQLMSDGSLQINGKCLDVNNGDTANGTTVQLWDCSGNTNQQWTYNGANELVNVNSGRCLDDPGGTMDSGTSLMIYDCWGGPNQQWSQPISSGLSLGGLATSSLEGALAAAVAGMAAGIGSAGLANSAAVSSAAGLAGLDQGALTPATANLAALLASVPAPTVVHSGQVKSGVAGGCLDDYGNSSANGATVDVWGCNGSGAQNWQLMSDGSLRINGKCLDVNGADTANGTTVQLWDCTGNTNQQWIYNDSNELVNVNSGRCLDDPNGTIGTGASLWIWDCWGGSNQIWSVPGGSLATAISPPVQGPNTPPFPVALSSGAVTSGVSGGCLDDYGNSSANGATVDVWGCNGSGAQNWQLMTDGSLQINGKCLDVNNGNIGNGTRVGLWDCTGNTNQQWIYNDSNELVNVNSGRCLDDPGGTIGTGTSLQIWDCWGGPNQRWSTPAGAVSGGGGGGSGITVTNPGGDLVVSMDDGGLDPNAVRQDLTTYWPQGVGLSPGASLNSLIQASYSITAGTVPGLPAPPSVPDASASVNGSTITIEVPAADVAQVSASKLPNYAAAIVSTVLGAIAGIFAMGVCLASFANPAGAALAPWIPHFCGGISGFANGFVYYIAYYLLNGTPLNGDAWATIMAGSLTWAAIGTGISAFITPKLVEHLPGLFAAVGQRMQPVIAAMGNWLGESAGQIALTVGGTIAGVAATIGAAVGILAHSKGWPTAVNGPGLIQSGIAGKCLDALGGGGSAGTIVDLWDCNGWAPAQSWTVYSNSTITINGECLETVGGGTGNGTKVQLGDCNGGDNQKWAQQGSALTQSGRCLDDPGGSTVNGTALQIWDCNGNSNQQWTLPALSS